MPDIVSNIANINQQINQLSNKKAVALLAISKTQPIEIIQQAYLTGQFDFGENYLQEALPKIQALEKTDIIWHFIGSIQSNKTKLIAQNFSWVHSVDSLKKAIRLGNQRPITQTELNICLQVNIDNEASKSGLTPIELPAVIEQCQKIAGIHLRGLMCIPKKDNQEQAFARMKVLFDQYPQLDTLSMGMSGDMALAIAYGSTMVRIGRGIFGHRPVH